MNFGSVCSGIEAASVAWNGLGWKAAWLSEIEPFPCAVLAHHYPDTPNLGDMTLLPEKIKSGEVPAPDLLCGGTPCQAFSVAGLRKSLDDARGNLTLTFCEIADAIDAARAVHGKQPSIIVWENVPGVLNTKDNAFGCFLGALAGCDSAIVPNGRWTNAGMVAGPKRAVAWRVLDAQYFGVAQRRRRVFVVASARTGFDPAAVLFERESVRRDTPPSREAGKFAPTIPSRSTAGGGLGTDFDLNGGLLQVVGSLDTECGGAKLTHQSVTNGHLIGTITARMFNAIGTRDVENGAIIPVAFAQNQFQVVACEVAETLTVGASQTWGRSGGEPIALHPTQDPISSTDVSHAIGTGSGRGCATAAVAFAQNQRDEVRTMDVAGALAAEPGMKQQTYIQQTMQVRRLTPRECERLQGFPDDYTLITVRNKPAADGPRYKALGNSWAVPVVRWIGQRICRMVAFSSP